MCLWTHYNIGSKRADCCALASDVEREIMYAMDMIQSPKFVFFSWAYSAQTVRPPPKLTHERHILGMSTSPRNDSHCPKLCRLSCSLITNTPRKYPLLAVLGAVKPPAQKFGLFSQVYACGHRFTSLVSKAVKISAGQVAESPLCIGDRKKQNTF